MALEKTIQKKAYGVTVTLENCYLKINDYCGNKESISINLYTYNKDRVTIVDAKMYSFVPNVDDNSTNFLKQGYEYLKTLSEFENAIDC